MLRLSVPVQALRRRWRTPSMPVGLRGGSGGSGERASASPGQPVALRPGARLLATGRSPVPAGPGTPAAASRSGSCARHVQLAHRVVGRRLAPHLARGLSVARLATIRPQARGPAARGSAPGSYPAGQHCPGPCHTQAAHPGSAPGHTQAGQHCPGPCHTRPRARAWGRVIPRPPAWRRVIARPAAPPGAVSYPGRPLRPGAVSYPTAGHRHPGPGPLARPATIRLRPAPPRPRRGAVSSPRRPSLPGAVSIPRPPTTAASGP